MLGGRTRRLAAYAAGELPREEQARLAPAVAACPRCQREMQAYQRASMALRAMAQLRLTAKEAADFLPEVNRRIDQQETPGLSLARPGFREMLWDHPRLSLASACTMVLLIIGLTVSQWQMGRLSGTAGRNGVDVISVDVDEDASVMVFQPPGSSLKVIWVFEDTAT
jgi:anti-sigma factor RsiW